MQPLKLFVSFCLASMLMLPQLAQSQSNAVLTSPFVYRIESSLCPPPRQDGKTTRIVTGFRAKGLRGIVTALHGVVGCKFITAQLIRGGIEPTITFRNLEIGKVDIQKDLALLWSDELVKLSLDGLEPISSATLSTNESLRSLGHPKGILEQDTTEGIKFIRQTELGSRIPPGSRAVFAERKSPAFSTQVLQLQGPLVPGLSGAPLLNKDGKLVGICNGGLDDGRIDRAWAIPWLSPPIEWKSVNEKVDPNVSNKDMDRMGDLEEADPSVLFNIPSQATGALLRPVTAKVKSARKLVASTAYDSSRWDDSYLGQKAIDNSVDQYWVTKKGTTVGAFLKILFSNPQVISRIGMYVPEKPDGQVVRQATLSFDDGTKQKVSFRGNTGWEIVEISPIVVQDIRLTIDSVQGKSNADYVAIYELQFFGEPVLVPDRIDKSEIKITKITDSSRWDDGYPGDKAIDNDLSGYWSTKSGDVIGTYLDMELIESSKVSRIALYNSPTYMQANRVRVATLAFADGSTQQVSFRCLNGWDYVDVKPIQTDKISMTVDEVCNVTKGEWLTIFELKFFGSSN